MIKINNFIPTASFPLWQHFKDEIFDFFRLFKIIKNNWQSCKGRLIIINCKWNMSYKLRQNMLCVSFVKNAIPEATTSFKLQWISCDISISVLFISMLLMLVSFTWQHVYIICSVTVLRNKTDAVFLIDWVVQF